MNEANYQRLLAHIDGLTERIPNWGFTNCLGAMVWKLQGKDYYDANQNCAEAIGEFLNINYDTASDLAYREPDELFEVESDGEMKETSLERQKEMIKHALETARSGEVEWLQ